MDRAESERNRGRGGSGCRAGRPGWWRFIERVVPGLCSLALFGATPAFEARWLTQLGFETVELRRTDENHLYRIGRADGRRLSCLVDTGWSYTTLQPHKATSNATSMTLRLGRVEFTNQVVRVEEVKFNGRRAPFDLVLGLDFLRAQSALVDCGSRRIYIRRGALRETDQISLDAALRRAGYLDIPLQLKTPPALTLAAAINGEPVELLLDSGAAWSCLDQGQCDRLKLRPQRSVGRITGVGETGIRPVAVAENISIRLGQAEFKAKTLALFDLADWGFAAPGTTLSEVQGILGGEWLAATDAMIDCARLKLWLKPKSRRERRPTSRDRN